MSELKTLSHYRFSMLPKLIYFITSRPERFGCHLWDHVISGNTLELSVKSDYRVEPEIYRMAVLHIGRVLQAIDQQAVLAGHTPQIQSFPNLEKSQLVALVRIHKFYGSDGGFSKSNGTKTNISGNVPALLQSIASHYGLFFNRYNGQSPDVSIGLQSNSYSLCATTDNPFVWLKTGQWLERVQQLADDEPSISLPDIECSLSKAQRSSLKIGFDDCPYVQALVEIS